MRKHIYIVVTTALFTVVHAQYEDLRLMDYFDSHSVERANYEKYDFSILFKDENSNYNLGVIGNNFRRIRLKFISVIKDENNPYKYFIYGKSNVNGNICEFQGLLTIDTIKIVNEMHLGVDDIYRDSSIVEQGLLIATYKFYENPAQKHVGMFEGKAFSNWYRKDNSNIIYDRIESFGDGWRNNQFIGSWQPYNSNKEKICNWGQARVPGTRGTLDIGVAYFWPSKEYLNEGWDTYTKAWDFPEWDKEARQKEQMEWWR